MGEELGSLPAPLGGALERVGDGLGDGAGQAADDLEDPWPLAGRELEGAADDEQEGDDHGDSAGGGAQQEAEPQSHEGDDGEDQARAPDVTGVVRVGEGAGVLTDEGLGDRPGQEHGQASQEEGDDGQDHCLGRQELSALGDGGQGGTDLTGGVLPGDDEGSQDRDHDLPECQALSDEVLGRVLVLLGLSEGGGEAGAEQNGQGDGDEGGDPGRAQGPELDPLGVHGAQEGLAALDAGARWTRCGACGGGPDGVAHRCGAGWGGGGVCGGVGTHG